jgi:ribosomal protein S18 acetylase RimI-like enzyme
VIRPIRLDDAEAVGAMAQELNAAMRALGDKNDGRFDATCFRRDGFGDQPAFKGLIAEAGGEAQGYLLYNEIYDTDLAQRALFVIDLYVRPAARGQGFGRALMDEAETLCRAADGGALLWAVLHQNATAMAFYETLGARYVDDVRFMVLRLPATS